MSETELFNISDSVFNAGRQKQAADMIEAIENEIDICTRHFDDIDCKTCSGLHLAIDIIKGSGK